LPFFQEKVETYFMKLITYAIIFQLIFSFIYCNTTNAQKPTVNDFKKELVAVLEKLKPAGFTKRTIKFENVVAGTANGGYYPFKVTAYIHDYGPGYPSNQYYGQTCLGKIDGWKYDLRKDEFGDWIVNGVLTVTNSTCKANPAEGVESIPLSTVSGEIFSGTSTGKTEVQQKPVNNASALYIGEYACYGTGGSLMAGMGFILKSDGTYSDLDGGRKGKYGYNANAATITFTGGFLGGQVGKNVKQTGFDLSNTVHAEPWR
jgi:hypothetical protein